MTERPMDESHEQKLKTVLGLQESENIPGDVIEIYWNVVRTCRKLNEPVRTGDLVLVAMLANRAVLPEPVSFEDEIVSGNVNRGDFVIAKFRNKWRWGEFLRYDKQAKKVIVQLSDESAEERKFSLTSVRLPSREELKNIGE